MYLKSENVNIEFFNFWILAFQNGKMDVEWNDLPQRNTPPFLTGQPPWNQEYFGFPKKPKIPTLPLTLAGVHTVGVYAPSCISSSTQVWFSSYLEQLGGGGCTSHLVSPVPHMVWSWNLHQTYPSAKDYDWWHHYFNHVQYVIVYRPDTKLVPDIVFLVPQILFTSNFVICARMIIVKTGDVILIVMWPG